MSVNKIVTKVDGTINKTIDFNDLKAGLAAGAHTITVEAYNGATLISTQTKNITIAAAVSYDADYQAVLDYATTNAIALPDSAQQDLDNQLMIDLKATGKWVVCKAFLNLKGTATSSFKLIDWKRLVKYTDLGSPTWSSSGIKGNGVNAYIDLAWNFEDIALGFNDVAIGFTLFDALVASDNPYNAIFGSAANATSTNQTRFYIYNGSFAAQLFNRSYGTIAVQSTDMNGFTMETISSADVRKLFLKGIEVGTATYSSTDRGSQHNYLLAQNRGGTPAGYCLQGLSNFIVLNAEPTSQEVQNFNTILG